MSCQKCNRVDMNNLAKGSIGYLGLQYATKYAGLHKHSAREKVMRTGVFAGASYIIDKGMLGSQMMSTAQIANVTGLCPECAYRDLLIVAAEILRDYMMKGADHKVGMYDLVNEIICVFGADMLQEMMSGNSYGQKK